jgi:hypothetical protein
MVFSYSRFLSILVVALSSATANAAQSCDSGAQTNILQKIAQYDEAESVSPELAKLHPPLCNDDIKLQLIDILKKFYDDAGTSINVDLKSQKLLSDPIRSLLIKSGPQSDLVTTHLIHVLYGFANSSNSNTFGAYQGAIVEVLKSQTRPIKDSESRLELLKFIGHGERNAAAQALPLVTKNMPMSSDEVDQLKYMIEYLYRATPKSLPWEYINFENEKLLFQLLGTPSFSDPELRKSIIYALKFHPWTEVLDAPPPGGMDLDPKDVEANRREAYLTLQKMLPLSESEQQDIVDWTNQVHTCNGQYFKQYTERSAVIYAFNLLIQQKAISPKLTDGLNEYFDRDCFPDSSGRELAIQALLNAHLPITEFSLEDLAYNLTNYDMTYPDEDSDTNKTKLRPAITGPGAGVKALKIIETFLPLPLKSENRSILNAVIGSLKYSPKNNQYSSKWYEDPQKTRDEAFSVLKSVGQFTPDEQAKLVDLGADPDPEVALRALQLIAGQAFVDRSLRGGIAKLIDSGSSEDVRVLAMKIVAQIDAAPSKTQCGDVQSCLPRVSHANDALSVASDPSCNSN